MEQQQRGKRSAALPITLVLLFFSLIGNVFLYSQFLQHKQENNFKTGQRIYSAAVESRQYMDELIPQLDALYKSEGPKDRLGIKFLAGKVSEKGHAMVDLTAEALSISTKAEKLNPELALTYISDVEDALQKIGSYEGPLNEAEQAYITALKNSFEEMSGILNGFNTNIADNRIAIIRLSSGLDWIELVENIQLLMTKQTAKLSLSN